MDEPEMMPCYKCGSDVEPNDKFCRDCGIIAPSQGMSWDWRAQPDWDHLNELLAPFGCRVVEVETSTDQHALRVESSKSNTQEDRPRAGDDQS